jgi:ribokinase
MSVAVFGSINTDVNAYLDRLPLPGETLHGHSYKIGLGGKGANQAVAAHRLGSDTRFICRTGPDIFGETATREIAAYGLKTDLIYCDPQGSTGLALINVARNGENAISLIGGSNMAMDENDVKRGGSAIASAKILLLQREVPFSASCAAAHHGKANGVIVILDPAPAPGKMFSREELDLFDILTPNELETAALIGWQPASPEDGLKAAKELLKSGVKTAIVKLGAKGVCVAGPRIEAFIKPFRVDAIDTVAAGDCFNGGLAHALEQGQPLKDAVRFAAACGALSTTKKGAAAAAPSKTEVEALLASQ